MKREGAEWGGEPDLRTASRKRRSGKLLAHGIV